MKSPAISIILPTHNRAALLREAIASVRAQTFTDWELLVIDDGSTDDTRQAVQSLCAQDARIRYVSQVNQGVAAARNAGISASRGGLIAFLDDDDRWIPAKLAIQAAFMQSHPQIGLSYTRYWFVGGSEAHSVCYPPELLTTLNELIQENCIATSTVMVRREAFDAAGRFDPAYQPVEDYGLWLRIAQRFPIAGIEAPLAVYTHRPGSQHLTQNRVALEHSALAVLTQLPLDGRWQSCRKWRRWQIAVVHYRLGRLHWDAQAYWQSATHFTLALATYPLVRVLVRTPREAGWQLVGQVIKSYLAVPWCVIKGTFHAAG